MGWFARLQSAEPHDGPDRPRPGESAPTFGQGTFDESVGVPIRVGGRLVAVLVGERVTGETPWDPEAIAILAAFAQARLEIDMLRRRETLRAHAQGTDSRGQRREAAVAATMVASGPVVPDASSPLAAEAVGIAPGGEETGIEPYVERNSGVRHWFNRREDARRYARLVAREIRLYNEESVLLGRSRRDIHLRLSEAMNRGRETFQRRFPELQREGSCILEEAFVDILAGGDRSLLESPR